jgi:hypothetical protein
MHLSPMHAEILAQDYDLEQITITQILRHSAGFFDHTNAPEFFEKVFSVPVYEWTRTAQLRLGVEQGEPVGPPGGQFSYSDMGYVILGELISNAWIPKRINFGFTNTFKGKIPTTSALRWIILEEEEFFPLQPN